MLKKYVVLFFLLFSSLSVMAQDYKPKIIQHGYIKISGKYPYAALENGHEGVVKLTFSVMPSGVIANIRVTKSSGSVVLDKAARMAVIEARARPMLIDDVPVETKYSTSITYKLLVAEETETPTNGNK